MRTLFQPGDIVQADDFGWQPLKVVAAKTANRRDPAVAPVQPWLGRLGMPGLSAYVCRSALESGALTALLPDRVPLPHEMTMIYPSRENPSRAQLAFRDHVGGYDFSGFR